MLATKIESVLFVANRPMNLTRLAEVCEAKKEEIADAVEALAARYNVEGSGVRILRNGSEVQMATSPESSKTVQDFLKDETTGELTKPSLETLTIIAYRGPVSKAELEQIRGVNCSIILRNLLMRGLVEVQGEPYDARAVYRVTMDFLRFLGVSAVEELPEYDTLRSHENVVRVVEMSQKPPVIASEAKQSQEGLVDEAPAEETSSPSSSSSS